MTDVKARQMSLDEWRELLKPYGYADVRTGVPWMPLGGNPPFVQYDIRMKLGFADLASMPSDRDEWMRRSGLLEQARQAVKAVQAKGFSLQDPPRIEFGGQYTGHPGSPERDWIAEAELRFSVVVLS
jgi:hypothetical protein